MNESPIVEQDASVAPRVKGVFPSGVRFGLRGSLDADDMARRALGTSESSQQQQQEGPEEAPPIPDTSSFAFKSISSVYVLLYGGTQKWDGRGHITWEDGTFSAPSTYAGAYVKITGGTDVAPGYVFIQIRRDTTDMTDCTIEFQLDYPDNDATYIKRVLMTAYLGVDANDDPLAYYVRDKRPDGAIGSPI